MPWNDSTGPVPHRTEDEFLALVRHKAAAADASQRRRRGAVAGAAALLMMTGLATVVVRRGPEPTTQLMTTGGPTSTGLESAPTSAPATSSTVPMTVATPPTSPTTRPVAAPTTRTSRPPASSTTTVACRNSIDPACGPFRWDPPLGPNRPLTVTVTYAPANPRPGDAVTFRVVVDDPDGDQLVDRTGMGNGYGDSPPQGSPNAIVDCLETYGPWTPPAPTPVHAELTFQHTYATPGTYVATFPFKSLGDRQCAYRGSQATGTATVTVAP